MVPYAPDNVDLKPVLVGRESETALLRMGITKALVGRGSVTTVAGAAGVGKSRLLGEIQDAASEHGMLVLSGNADPRSSRIPYGLFVDVLGQCMPHLAPRKRDVWKEKVEHLAPHLGDTLFPGSEDHRLDGAELDPYVRHTLFLAALVDMLLRRAEQHPLFIALEDVHWADSASLRALRYLVSRIAGSRLMIVATFRPGEGELQDEMADALEHFQSLSHSSQVELDALSQVETRALVGSCFPESNFSNDLLDRVCDGSNGSPSFVMQYLELLREVGVIFADGDLWTDHPVPDPEAPDSMPTLARERLLRLSVQEREVFTFAAPQGVTFDPQLVARALDQPYVKVLQTLAGLERTQHVVRSGRGQYRFASIICVNAFLADLPPVRLRRAHLRLAGCLEQMHASEVEKLAHHLYRGGAGERALPYLIDAGRRAKECESFWEANGFLQQALEIMAASGTKREKRLEVTLSLAEVAELLGDLKRADALCREILDAASPETDLCTIGQAMSLRGWLRYRAGSWETALASYERALGIFSDLGEEELLAQTHLRLGNIAFERSQMQTAITHFDQARKLALEAGDVRMLGGIYGNLGVISSVRGDDEQAVAAYAEALQAHRRSNNDYGVAQTMHNLGMTYAGRGDWEEALSCYTEGERLGRDMGTVDVLANILVSRAAAQIGVGDVDGAGTSNDAARIYYEEMNDPLGLAECDKISGIVSHQRGQHVAAAVALLTSRRSFRSLENQLGVAECELELAHARRSRGDFQEAQQFCKAAIIHFEEAGAYTQLDRAQALLAELDN